MKDKITLLMEETGCEQGEAELALELCGYELEKAVAAVPRLFQNIIVLKGKFKEEVEGLYGLLLIILNLREHSLLRAKSVVSYNPAIYAASLEQNWFEFEKHLYASRLWEGTLQPLSQEIEQLMTGYFSSEESAPFYSDSRGLPVQQETLALRSLLGRRFAAEGFRLLLQRDVLDMGQFQEIRPYAGNGRRPGTRRRGPSRGGPLILRITLEGSPDGVEAADLRAGDMVYAQITDTRDIAQYLSKLFGPGASEDTSSLLVPVEAVESGPSQEIGIRVRFSLGVCGDVNVAPETRLKVIRRSSRSKESWWKKFFG